MVNPFENMEREADGQFSDKESKAERKGALASVAEKLREKQKEIRRAKKMARLALMAFSYLEDPGSLQGESEENIAVVRDFVKKEKINPKKAFDLATKLELKIRELERELASYKSAHQGEFTEEDYFTGDLGSFSASLKELDDFIAEDGLDSLRVKATSAGVEATTFDPPKKFTSLTDEVGSPVENEKKRPQEEREFTPVQQMSKEQRETYVREGSAMADKIKQYIRTKKDEASKVWPWQINRRAKLLTDAQLAEGWLKTLEKNIEKVKSGEWYLEPDFASYQSAFESDFRF
jgi:hypothetical protein